MTPSGQDWSTSFTTKVNHPALRVTGSQRHCQVLCPSRVTFFDFQKGDFEISLENCQYNWKQHSIQYGFAFWGWHWSRSCYTGQAKGCPSLTRRNNETWWTSDGPATTTTLPKRCHQDTQASPTKDASADQVICPPHDDKTGVGPWAALVRGTESYPCLNPTHHRSWHKGAL